MPRKKVYQAIYEGKKSDGTLISGVLCVAEKPILADNYNPDIITVDGYMVDPYSLKFLKMEEVRDETLGKK